MTLSLPSTTRSLNTSKNSFSQSTFFFFRFFFVEGHAVLEHLYAKTSTQLHFVADCFVDGNHLAYTVVHVILVH